MLLETSGGRLLDGGTILTNAVIGDDEVERVYTVVFQIVATASVASLRIEESTFTVISLELASLGSLVRVWLVLWDWFLTAAITVVDGQDSNVRTKPSLVNTAVGACDEVRIITIYF